VAGEAADRMSDVYSQNQFEARFDWGEEGLRALAPFAGAVVIVDVLSFTTAVDIAVSRNATVYPARWKDERAARMAAELEAVLAVPRNQVSPERPYALSPPTLRNLPEGSRIVLPSPNGATLSTIAAESGVTVLAGCLRNASAVAGACRDREGGVAVIAAGERWQGTGGLLRPALEDLLGAGAILDALASSSVSPEARAAIAAFRDARDRLPETLRAAAGGRELIEWGYAEDVEVAAELDASTAVPHLRDGYFFNDNPREHKVQG
jgi:2-phosphosulfolactate phosphatase